MNPPDSGAFRRLPDAAQRPLVAPHCHERSAPSPSDRSIARVVPIPESRMWYAPRESQTRNGASWVVDMARIS